ncbi:unnamed protein product [Thelazia callipaeda]|uniref:Testicular haploid expressed gene protein-like n=1 Tax=Thelazia callipaeda TaxID=103827 RepID=A0A0N5CMU8_THECL|nr:unnamed protein product [Thelazia callipaeda]
MENSTESELTSYDSQKSTSTLSGRELEKLSKKNDKTDLKSLISTHENVKELIPTARKHIREQPVIRYNPWMPWEKLSKRDAMFSRTEASLNAAWNAALFMDQKQIKRSSKKLKLLQPKVSINQRARRITFSVLNRSNQTSDSFNIDEFPMKNS